MKLVNLLVPSAPIKAAYPQSSRRQSPICKCTWVYARNKLVGLCVFLLYLAACRYPDGSV